MNNKTKDERQKGQDLCAASLGKPNTKHPCATLWGALRTPGAKLQSAPLAFHKKRFQKSICKNSFSKQSKLTLQQHTNKS